LLAVGARAPDFVLRDQNNQEVRLSSYAGRRAVLLVFYPLAFTGICGGELRSLQSSLEFFSSAGVEVLTVSVDSVFSHKVWADREGFSFPLLADFWPHGAVAASYGVFNPSTGVADRGTFLISRDGTIAYASVQGPGSRREVAAWRDAVAAL
jgi:peroxiredoxin (alkyl hydroperoxide reductase subunit C)